MEVEPFLISSTLNLIIAQRLVRKISDKKEKYKLKDSELENLAKYCDLDRVLEILQKEKIAGPKSKLSDVDFYRPESGSGALGKGYEGRIGIYEILKVTDTIKEMIVNKATSDKIQEQGKKEDMITMVEDGFIKAAKGLTSIEEVLRVIIE